MNKTLMILAAVIGIGAVSYWGITSQNKTADEATKTTNEVVQTENEDSVKLDTFAQEGAIVEEEEAEKVEEKPLVIKEKTPSSEPAVTTKKKKTISKKVTPIAPVKKETAPPIVKKETASPKVTPKKAAPKTTTKPVEKTKVKPKAKPIVPKKKAPVVEFSHDAWDKLLRKYVSASGKVNYAGFKKDQAALKAYLKLLSDNPPKSSDSRNKQLAYWINAYNAFTIDLIVANYPIKSILKLDGGKTWYVKRITIGGKKYSLSGIEKDILIGRFKEGRIHFAINCAAKSCPPLMNRAWTAQNLTDNLNRATRNFINNQGFNKIKKKSAKLSHIFDWYQADFGNVTAFINQYSATKMSTKAKIEYLDYNWDLNQ